MALLDDNENSMLDEELNNAKHIADDLHKVSDTLGKFSDLADSGDNSSSDDEEKKNDEDSHKKEHNSEDAEKNGSGDVDKNKSEDVSKNNHQSDGLQNDNPQQPKGSGKDIENAGKKASQAEKAEEAEDMALANAGADASAKAGGEAAAEAGGKTAGAAAGAGGTAAGAGAAEAGGATAAGASAGAGAGASAAGAAGGTASAPVALIVGLVVAVLFIGVFLAALFIVWLNDGPLAPFVKTVKVVTEVVKTVEEKVEEVVEKARNVLHKAWCRITGKDIEVIENGDTITIIEEKSGWELICEALASKYQTFWQQLDTEAQDPEADTVRIEMRDSSYNNALDMVALYQVEVWYEISNKAKNQLSIRQLLSSEDSSTLNINNALQHGVLDNLFDQMMFISDIEWETYEVSGKQAVYVSGDEIGNYAVSDIAYAQEKETFRVENDIEAAMHEENIDNMTFVVMVDYSETKHRKIIHVENLTATDYMVAHRWDKTRQASYKAFADALITNPFGNPLPDLPYLNEVYGKSASTVGDFRTYYVSSEDYYIDGVAVVDMSWINKLGFAGADMYNTCKILPSFFVAQCLYESGFPSEQKEGETSFPFEYFNFALQRYSASCSPFAVCVRAKSKSGTLADYCGYASFEFGVSGYFQWYQTMSSYSAIIGETNLDRILAIIGGDNISHNSYYAGTGVSKSEYDTAIKNLILTYDLTYFDRLAFGEVDTATEYTSDKPNRITRFSQLTWLTGKDADAVELLFSGFNNYMGWQYSQPLRDHYGYSDCSSLAYKVFRDIGIDISYHGAYSAAEEARGLVNNGKIIATSYNPAILKPGDLLFWKHDYYYEGHWNNIYHVAIYCGNGYVFEAVSEGVCCRPIWRTNEICYAARLLGD